MLKADPRSDSLGKKNHPARAGAAAIPGPIQELEKKDPGNPGDSGGVSREIPRDSGGESAVSLGKSRWKTRFSAFLASGALKKSGRQTGIAKEFLP